MYEIYPIISIALFYSKYDYPLEKKTSAGFRTFNNDGSQDQPQSAK